MTDQLLKTIKNSRDYTMAVAELMPMDQYTAKLKNAGWNFLEQMHHIAYGLQWWQDNFIVGKKSNWNQPAIRGGKKEAMEYLQQSYDSLVKTIESDSLDEAMTYGVYATLDHVTHHRAQAIVYLRIRGIHPPEYTF